VRDDSDVHSDLRWGVGVETGDWRLESGFWRGDILAERPVSSGAIDRAGRRVHETMKRDPC